MNGVDIIIILPIIFLGWRGFKKGLIIEVFTLLALLVGIYIGINFSDFVAQALRDSMGMTSEYVPVIAFTITFLGVGAMVYFAGVMLEKAINLAALKMVNKMLGMFLGIVKALYLLSVIIVILEAYDEKSSFIPDTSKKGSLLYQPIQHISLQTIPALRYSDLFIDLALSKDKQASEETSEQETEDAETEESTE